MSSISISSIWIEDDASEDIIPAEIALIEMTLREGIVRKFVQMIDPGDLPEGFKGEMMINKEKYHDMPQTLFFTRDRRAHG